MVPVGRPAGWRPRRTDLKSKGSLLENSFFLGMPGFCSIQVFNWLDEAHPNYRKQFAYSEFADLNVIPI